MIKYNGQMCRARFTTDTTRSYDKQKGLKTKKHSNDILTFDIEVTSAWRDSNGNIIRYEKGKDAEYWNSLEPLALCYIWQFSFNNTVYYGRELKDFEKVLKDLPKDIDFVIWVHNLAYEFHFLNNFIDWKTVFARTPHKPMKCVPKNYPNIEFRCSYMLTRLSLDSWGKQIGFHKDVGDLDYEVIRTPLTELTEKELKYCEDDCLVVYHGIQTYLKRYGNIRSIPLTQTGTVRRDVKEKLMSDPKYNKYIKGLVPSDADEYGRLIDVFSGGYTHANRFYSDRIVSGYIEHYDFASSYPSVMVCEKYPSTVWLMDFPREIPTKEDAEKYAYIMRVRFTDLECDTLNTYIQASKCTGRGFKYDNGRIINADELEITLTEQDLFTILETYSFSKCEVLEKYRSVKKYLPKAFIEYILDLYHNKTTLKDNEEMYDLYMQSKQYINSLFGMCVTAIIQPVVSFDGEEWSVEKMTADKVNERLISLRLPREREKRYFLSYSWGCYITAYARRNLWRCILSCDPECIYCDTDSIFVLGKHDFSWYNDEVNMKMRRVCDELGIDFSRTRPKTPKGKEKPLGIFAPEDVCSEFKTLGAKRYVERRINDGKLHLTVSGINKEAVGLLNDDIDNFEDGFDFDKDSDFVHKQLSTYLTNMPVVKYPDGYISTYRKGINLRRTGYLLTIADDYKSLLDLMELAVYSIDDDSKIRIQNYFPRETGRN